MNLLLRTPALLSTLLLASLGASAATEAPPVARSSTAITAASPASLSAPADPSSHKALALLAAGVGMVVFVSRRRHDD